MAHQRRLIFGCRLPKIVPLTAVPISAQSSSDATVNDRKCAIDLTKLAKRE